MQDNIQAESVKEGRLKKAVTLITYLSFAPAFLIFLIVFSLYLNYDVSGYITRQIDEPSYTALPEPLFTSEMKAATGDARSGALKEFLSSYNSPLEPHAEKIISEADKYDIDYRILPAIAMQESTLCKKIIKDSHNCWGFGIYGNKVTKFKDYNHAIEVITKTLAEKYIHAGLKTPDEIVTKYTPSDDGKWVNTVNMVMTRIHETM